MVTSQVIISAPIKYLLIKLPRKFDFFAGSKFVNMMKMQCLVQMQLAQNISNVVLEMMTSILFTAYK